MAQNAAILGITIAQLCDDDALSPFNRQGPHNLWETTPPGLQPTALQRAVHHHPWIDLFPVPQLRDSFIRLFDNSVDEDVLCVDLIRVEGGNGEKPNLIVWGDPSDPCAWEASVPFLRKWGWVVRDCRELLDATNYWRAKRGERTLIFETT